MKKKTENRFKPVVKILSVLGILMGIIAAKENIQKEFISMLRS